MTWEKNMQPIPVYAHLNARIMPVDRGERFEDPLADALAEKGFGEVTGGGTMQSSEGEIEFCGIDIDLFDAREGVPFISDFLTQCGAPKGSKLEYELEEKKIEASFGEVEGLAIYLNGTDLPANVYQECDINEVVAQINRLLDKHGAIGGYWQGPKETALYLYGASATAMQKRIAGYMAEYPLCQRARVVQIA